MSDRPDPVIRGVNLGGWLVLEKWMTPSLFAQTAAVDEHSLCSALAADREPNDDRLTQHRDTFVTEADFAWLAAHGVTSVRLPVGSWTFGDEPPYAATIDYVDRAFAWAQRHGLSVLLGLHGAPGSQNGQDHSGRAGATLWHTDPQHAAASLEVIERLAIRYGTHPALLGIELLNEPSHHIPFRVLRRYYARAYGIVRRYADARSWVVFNIFSTPWRWQRSLRSPRFHDVYADLHQYRCFRSADKRADLSGHLRAVVGPVRRQLVRIGRAHPVLIGEWSLALDPRSLRGIADADQREAYRAYGRAQLATFDRTARAWFYWSYKTEGGGVWSFRDCVEQGLLDLPS